MNEDTTGPADAPNAPEGVASRSAKPRPWLMFATMLVVGVLLGAAGIAVAADSPGSTPSSSTTRDQDDDKSDRPKDKVKSDRRANGKGHARGLGKGLGHGRGHGRLNGKHLMGGGPHGALHGEFVVAGRDGKFQTMVVQRGEVTAVSARSITLKSADGFSATYAVTQTTRVRAQGGGITSIAKGNAAGVVAIRAGGKLTARLVDGKNKPLQEKTPKPKPSATSTSPTTTP